MFYNISSKNNIQNRYQYKITLSHFRVKNSKIVLTSCKVISSRVLIFPLKLCSLLIKKIWDRNSEQKFSRWLSVYSKLLRHPISQFDRCVRPINLGHYTSNIHKNYRKIITDSSSLNLLTYIIKPWLTLAKKWSMISPAFSTFVLCFFFVFLNCPIIYLTTEEKYLASSSGLTSICN